MNWLVFVTWTWAHVRALIVCLFLGRASLERFRTVQNGSERFRGTVPEQISTVNYSKFTATAATVPV